MTTPSRKHLLLLLVGGDAPIAEIVEQLAAFEWDSDRELVVLTRAHALSMLDRYLQGEVDRAAVEAWAEAIEGREDIGYEPEAEEILGDLVFELANPELAATLDTDRASAWVQRMQ